MADVYSAVRTTFGRFANVGTWLGKAAMVWVVFLVVLAIFAPWIAPYDATAIQGMPLPEPPSGAHWFGTDEIGRDILSRLIVGARVTVRVVVLSVMLAMVIGSIFGLIAGYFGGIGGMVIMRTMDALLAFPMLILALSIVALLGPGEINAILAIGIVNVPKFARLVRGEVLTLMHREYVVAARSIGMSNTRVIARHIWPNLVGNVVVFSSLTAAHALITEAALSFLGLGIQPPHPSWGGMISAGLSQLDSWWIVLFPGLVIFLLVLALNIIGDLARDVFDVRLANK